MHNSKEDADFASSSDADHLSVIDLRGLKGESSFHSADSNFFLTKSSAFIVDLFGLSANPCCFLFSLSLFLSKLSQFSAQSVLISRYSFLILLKLFHFLPDSSFRLGNSSLISA